MNKKGLVILSSFVLVAILVAGKTRAEDYVISGNGTGSNNQLDIQKNNSKTVQQGSQTNIKNDAKSNADTGGNTVDSVNGPAKIVTGNANSSVTINSDLNTNSANVGGCCPPGETPPTPPTPPVPPGPPTGDGGKPPSGGSGGGGGGAGGGGGQGGGGGGVGGGGPQVLGLSATDGPTREESLFYLLGSVCLTSGVMLLKNKLGLGFLG